MNDKYDIIVVGAGFGGPIVAKKCADAGLRTLMIERSQNVGDKVISGLICLYGMWCMLVHLYGRSLNILLVKRWNRR